MNKSAYISYSKADVEATHNLSVYLHNIKIQEKINKVYKRMSFCDDIQMQEHLARKIKRLRKELIQA